MSSKPEMDEINFKEVVKTPIRWFGLIYFYILILIIVVGLYYNYNLGRVQRNDIPPALTDSANVFKDVKEVKGTVSKSIDLKLLMNPSTEMIKKGKTLFMTNCVTCHGENGKGDGIAGAALNPKPRNFHSTTGWKNGRKFSEMFKTLEEGISGSAMPSYSYLSNEDRHDLIFYIRKFTNDFPKVDESEVDVINQKYNLSEGQSIPSQIPVALAKEKMIEDVSPEVEKVSSLFSIVNKNPDAEGAKILNKVSENKFRIFSFLANNTVWNAGLDDFVKTVIATSPTNGFNEKIVTLSKNEWNELYEYINKLFSQVG